MSKRFWVCVIFCSTFLAAGCASLPLPSVFASSFAPEDALPPDDELEQEATELVAMLRHDLGALRARERDRNALYTPPPAQKREKRNATGSQPSLADTAMFNPEALNRRVMSNISLMMPVLGVRSSDLTDSWGNSRDGGRRRHRGIDIFAPKGTAVVAVTDGYVSYIGEQPKGGRCMWLVTEDDLSFYYAHLDRWAPGLYEGMEVKAGDILGYVGNTGNARSTPSHLHFAVHNDGDAVNPYSLLKFGMLSKGTLSGGFSRGTR